MVAPADVKPPPLVSANDHPDKSGRTKWSSGAVRPVPVGGTTFAMGGFSAQYGDLPSGVLAIESKDRPREPSRYPATVTCVPSTNSFTKTLLPYRPPPQ